MRHRRQENPGALARAALTVVTFVLLALAFVPAARAGFWGRDALDSAWTATPVKVDGDDGEWPQVGAFEDGGLGVQALNDKTKLYLKATSSTREGRAQLLGLTKQDVTFWFYQADGKTRSWGLRVPFSRLTPPDEDELRYGPVVSDPNSGLQPEFLRLETVAGSSATVVSSSTWPSDMEFRMGFTGRRPVWEMSLPLSRLTPDAKGAYPLDFLITGKARKLAPRKLPPGKTKPGAPPPSPPGEPEPVDFILSLRLARDPSLPR
ncbi:MAG: hypothetical protein HKL90_12905 [Elusimicrobia bacterium]|nr:hypothetical protein [Elusimicrobiota bacterium]